MASAAQRRIKSISYARFGYFFILPFFIVYLLFQLMPLILTFVAAFKGNLHLQPNEINHNNLATIDDFVGFSNFKDLLFGASNSNKYLASTQNSLEFWHSLKTTVILWIGNFIPQICLSLLLAVWFTDAKIKIYGKGFFKVVMYLPNILTAASVAALFKSLLGDDPQVPGPINQWIMDNGWKDEVIRFVQNTSKYDNLRASDLMIQRGMIMGIQTWLWFGNTMLMLMSGIMGINGSLFEAANIDGASSGQVFRHITLPLLRPIMLYTLVTSMIGGLQMFDIPLLYRQGPTVSTVNPGLETVAIFIYKNIDVGGNVGAAQGYAGSASVILFIITGILGAIAFHINRDKDAIAKKKYIKKLIKQQKAKSNQPGLGAMGRL